MKNKKVMVTGAAGFIGSSICRSICDDNEVIAIDNFSTGRKENLLGIKDKINFIELDINETEELIKIMDGCDYVLHQAAIPSVPRSVDNPVLTNTANVDGTLSVLEASRHNDIKKIVFAASSSAYGDTEVLPKVETMIPQPLSPYAVQKLTCEYYSKIYWDIYGLETCSLRYFNVFGPRQDPFSDYAAVIPKFITLVRDKKPLTIFGDGTQTRDFTFIENVIQANLKAAVSNSKGKVMNIGCGTRISLNAMVDMLEDILNCQIERKHLEPRQGDVMHSLASIELARKEIGYIPQVDFKTGLEKTCEWFLSS